MSLVYADLCTQCHKHKTRHPSGVCSYCRKRPKPSKPCIVCGAINTSHPSGVCAKCRAGLKGDDAPEYRIDDAIKEQKLILFILEQRKNNVSFTKIAEKAGVSKSACYSRFLRACKRPSAITENYGIDSVDGSSISDDPDEVEEAETIQE